MGAFVLGLAHGRCVSREWHLPLLPFIGAPVAWLFMLANSANC